MGGVTAPSSRNLWDIVKKDQFEQHDARHIHDIWMEVGVSGDMTCVGSPGRLHMRTLLYAHASLPFYSKRSFTQTQTSIAWQRQ